MYRSLHNAAFSGKAVSRNTFEQLMEALKGLALLDHVPGHKVSDDPSDTGRFAARFRATPTLLTFCTEQGVVPTAVLDHFEFEYDLPSHPVALRARKLKTSYSSTELVGKPMEFERTGVVMAMEAAIHELNDFFSKQTLRGGLHQGYIRKLEPVELG